MPSFTDSFTDKRKAQDKLTLSKIKPNSDGAIEADSIVDFLKTSGRSHRCYYHYTDLRSVVGMIKNNKFHLSCGEKMNDGDEIHRGNTNIWNHIYLASFNFGDNENMALWGLYSIPWETGVRVEIPGKVMRAWIDGLKHKSPLYLVGKDSQKNFTYDLIDNPYRAILTDVVYAENKASKKDNELNLQNALNLRHYSGRLDVPEDMDSDPRMTGFVKNMAWSYEQEVRIRIDTHIPLVNNSWSGSPADGEHIVEQVAVDFPDEIINECMITACPWFEGNLEEKLLGIIRDIGRNEYIPFKRIGRSKFDDLVNNMKQPCWQCTQGHFKQKP